MRVAASRTLEGTAPLPRPLAWLVLAASAVAVLMVGGVGTLVILTQAGSAWPSIRPLFWGAFLAACALTVASLGIRAARWAFLLRHAGIRVPIRDACVGFFSGLSLLFVPLLAGEIAVRAVVQKARRGVPVAATCVINVWERALDVVALVVIVLVCSARWAAPWMLGGLAIVALSMVRPVRRAALASLMTAARRWTGRFDRDAVWTSVDVCALGQHRAWLPAFSASVAAWILPALGFWALARAWGLPLPVGGAQRVYASSALAGGLLFAPGGILVVGRGLLAALVGREGDVIPAALVVVAARLATAGVAAALGLVFVAVHARSGPSGRGHFDALAPAYDTQIPEPRRRDLVVRKTELMRRVLEARRAGRSGLDVGCGQGWHIRRMRELGFEVTGIDQAPGQVAMARRNAGLSAVQEASVLAIPVESGSLDFVYVINVLHHLASEDDQRTAFAELERVVRPGGLLFLHEINTRNVLFRLYMAYLFPVLHCIDEGDERWLLPDRLGAYTRMPVARIEYFTFLPEFLPASLVRLLRPVERALERSRLNVYAAHYMAAFEKPA